jgi:hypothetical protein
MSLAAHSRLQKKPLVEPTSELLTGQWWVDAVTSLAIIWFLVKEGREAWSGGKCESCC